MKSKYTVNDWRLGEARFWAKRDRYLRGLSKSNSLVRRLRERAAFTQKRFNWNPKANTW